MHKGLRSLRLKVREEREAGRDAHVRGGARVRRSDGEREVWVEAQDRVVELEVWPDPERGDDPVRFGRPGHEEACAQCDWREVREDEEPARAPADVVRGRDGRARAQVVEQEPGRRKSRHERGVSPHVRRPRVQGKAVPHVQAKARKHSPLSECRASAERYARGRGVREEKGLCLDLFAEEQGDQVGADRDQLLHGVLLKLSRCKAQYTRVLLHCVEM